MREILFRGKREDNEEWVEGAAYEIPDSGGTVVIMYLDLNPVGWKRMLVYEETVGQYTGLKDKNGKRIFEGDIVQLQSDYNKKGVIKFGRHEVPSEDPFCWGEAYGFYIAGNVFDTCLSIYRSESDNFGSGDFLEVIGNIHDNPELADIVLL